MQGWDKTYCLQFVEKEHSEIHFFGDKCFEVGWPSFGLAVMRARCSA